MPRHQYYLPQRKLVSQDDAALIQSARVPRSKFIGSWTRLTTFDAGKLIPFLVEEVLPGDHLRYNVVAYVRMSTALFPLYSNQRVDTHFFFVPNRLTWTNWVKLMGEQTDPDSSIAYTIPTIIIGETTATIGSLYDHLGIPPQQIAAGQTIGISALPCRAYSLIYNTWFRDQNIIDSAATNVTSDGPDTAGDYAIQRRAKSHDYFTSGLPWPQKFTPLQTLFTGTAPIIGLGTLGTTQTPTAGPNTFRETAEDVSYPANILLSATGTQQLGMRFDSATVGARPQVYADLAQATGVTINALRNAWLVQDLLERDARGGTRYVELIRSHFGVTSPDFRLQRPEYIGGGQTPLNITPIAQTTPTGGGGLGALGGTGTAAGQHTASYAATEHGYIIGLISIKSELAYQQGIHRHFFRSVRTDFYFPSLAGLGEQSIPRREIYVTGAEANDDAVFAYQERWHEYRTRYSDVSGLFRSQVTGNIDEWHLAQQFSTAPTLSQAFIEDDPPMARVLAAGSAAAGMQYLADIHIQRTAVRPVPMFGTPATLARF